MTQEKKYGTNVPFFPAEFKSRDGGTPRKGWKVVISEAVLEELAKAQLGGVIVMSEPKTRTATGPQFIANVLAPNPDYKKNQF